MEKTPETSDGRRFQQTPENDFKRVWTRKTVQETNLESGVLPGRMVDACATGIETQGRQERNGFPRAREERREFRQGEKANEAGATRNAGTTGIGTAVGTIAVLRLCCHWHVMSLVPLQRGSGIMVVGSGKAGGESVGVCRHGFMAIRRHSACTQTIRILHARSQRYVARKSGGYDEQSQQEGEEFLATHKY
jgi:hypothetical protein